MKSVRVANLKNHLSDYLREVSEGHEIAVFNRDIPIARLIPFPKAQTEIEVQPPKKRKGNLKKMEFFPVHSSFDVLQALLEERDRG